MSQRRHLTSHRAIKITLVVAVLVSGYYFASQSGSNPDAYSNDFNVYYHAAREVIEGRDPYQHSLGDWTPYMYPPLLADLMIPLALLPLPVAAYVWFLISAASIIAAAWMSAGLASEGLGYPRVQSHNQIASIRAWIAAIAVVVVLRFVLDTFNLGQVNGIVAALVVAHVYLYTRDRKTMSTIALVLAVSIKLTPALLLVYHIAKLRIRFALAATALLVAITVMSLLPFGSRGPDVFRTFWNRTVTNEQGYDFAYPGNQSLRGAIARLSDTEARDRTQQPRDESRKPSDLLTLAISIVLFGLAVLTAVRARWEMAAVAPIVCCMVILSPLSWKAHYVMLILPAAYLLSLVRTRRAISLLVSAVLATAFVLFNLTSPRLIGLIAAEWADAHSLVLLGALLIYGACLVSGRLAASR